MLLTDIISLIYFRYIYIYTINKYELLIFNDYKSYITSEFD